MKKVICIDSENSQKILKFGGVYDADESKSNSLNIFIVPSGLWLRKRFLNFSDVIKLKCIDSQGSEERLVEGTEYLASVVNSNPVFYYIIHPQSCMGRWDVKRFVKIEPEQSYLEIVW